jgi:hypothetical protein
MELVGVESRGMRWRHLALVPLLVITFVVVTLTGGDVLAEPQTLAGSWSATPMSESVKIGSWVDECGPKPVSSSSPGGAYKISISGDELVFSGGKSFRTDQCWDMGLAKRVSHSATPSIRYWKTRCESPAGDPRKATITTVVRAVDDDTILLSETAHYSSTMSSGDCSATVERSRTFKIVARDGATPAASSSPSAAPSPSPSITVPPKPTVTTPPAPVCTSVGEPATLEVKPRRKVVRPGEQFDFLARILDANGCVLGAKTTFRLAPESSSITTVVVDANGHIKVAADAEPVVATLLVEGAQKSARVELEVVSDQRYAELLAAGAGDASADDQAVAIVLSSGGGGSATVVDPGKQEAKRFRFGWLALVGGVATLLGLAAIVLWRRGTPARVPSDVAREPAPPPPPPSIPPPSGVAVQPKRRICPVCGTRYEGEAAFCSKDGVELVPLN